MRVPPSFAPAETDRAHARARQSGRAEQAVFDAGDGVQIHLTVAPDGERQVWHVGMWEPGWQPPIAGMTPTLFMRTLAALTGLAVLAIALSFGASAGFVVVAVLAVVGLWLLERRRPAVRASGAIADVPDGLQVDHADEDAAEAARHAIGHHLGLAGVPAGPTTATHRLLWDALQPPPRRSRLDITSMLDPRSPRRR